MAPADLKEQIPGISGTRALNDNLSDMKAQVASNFKGIGLVTALIEEYTLEVVQAYMHHIQVRIWNQGLYQDRCVFRVGSVATYPGGGSV